MIFLLESKDYNVFVYLLGYNSREKAAGVRRKDVRKNTNSFGWI